MSGGIPSVAEKVLVPVASVSFADTAASVEFRAAPGASVAAAVSFDGLLESEPAVPPTGVIPVPTELISVVLPAVLESAIVDVPSCVPPVASTPPPMLDASHECTWQAQ